MTTATCIKWGPATRYLLSLMVLCFCLPLLTSCGGQRTIVNGLDEKEANNILVFLASRGIDATKIKQDTGGGGGGNKPVLWDISVDPSQATEAMYLLNQQGLPRRGGQNLLSIFSSSGLVPSDLQEKIKYRAGLSEQIANTIRRIDGVLDADVQISFPEEDPLNPGQSKGKITASVFVKHNGILDDPNSHLLTKIKRLVAASVTGLDYDNVTVVTERSRMNEPTLSSVRDEDKQYVSIWSIIVAKESVTRFRVIFFSFCLVILALGLGLLWILWKTLPLVHKQGGAKALFSLSPLTVSHTTPIIEKKAEGEKPPAKPEEKGEKSHVEKGVDET